MTQTKIASVMGLASVAPRRDRRKMLLAAAAAPLHSWLAPIGLAAPPAGAARRQMSVLEALEVCGVDAESFLWPVRINACLGFDQVMFTIGDAEEASGGAVAATVAMNHSVRAALRNAPSAALVVRGRSPGVLTLREAFAAYREVRLVAPPGATVLYALWRDDEAVGIQVALAIGIDTNGAGRLLQ